MLEIITILTSLSFCVHKGRDESWKRDFATFSNLTERDLDIQYKSYEELMKIMQEPVDWTYSVWEQLVQALTYRNGHVRASAAQFLCALAAKVILKKEY